MDNPASPRDEQGRFVPGSPGGPGRPRGHGKELRHSAQHAITPQHIDAIMRKALRMGLEGNLSAMKFVVERTCGRAPEAPAEGLPLDITLPKLQTVADCTAAIDRVLEAVCQGAIDRESATILVDLINARIKAIEATELEARLTELEKSAATVDLPGSRNMRRL